MLLEGMVESDLEEWGLWSEFCIIEVSRPAFDTHTLYPRVWAIKECTAHSLDGYSAARMSLGPCQEQGGRLREPVESILTRNHCSRWISTDVPVLHP